MGITVERQPCLASILPTHPGQLRPAGLRAVCGRRGLAWSAWSRPERPSPALHAAYAVRSYGVGCWM